MVQEALLVDLVEQALLAVPAGDRVQVFLTFFLRPKVAHLDHDERVLIRRSGSKEYIGIQLTRYTFDTVAEMFD